jgi:class 3 adenylate cyclase
MSIRTYLALSYLALILLVTSGMFVVANRALDRLTLRNLTFAEEGALALTTANFELSKEVLTQVGEYVVQDKARDVAREVARLLGGKKTYDYARLRRDPKLRALATQAIYTPSGPAGYTDLYDKGGEILFHPDPKVEGQNQANEEWRRKYPETWELIKRSLSEDNVTGYFNFFDKAGKDRQRYSARVHVPGTPFIVGAIVNIDEFFQPVQDRMEKASLEIVARARQQIEAHAAGVHGEMQMLALLGGVVFSILGCLGGFGFAATISRPILKLRDGVRKVGEGDFSVSVPARGAAEVIHLAESFNQLGAQLIDYMEKRDYIRDTFGRYVTQEVVKRLLESKEALELGGETREVSLLMSDLRGFTALTTDMQPDQVITFLNRYLGKMIEILTDYRAVVDEIVGDGILAFFGAPEPQEDHPVRAVACALSMQAAMDEINFLNEADGLPHLEMGLGVNTGTVVVGNIGSELRAKYSVVGSPVNVTGRMEACSVGGQVLIGPATYARVADYVEVRNTIQVQMKGVPGATTLYDIRGISGPYNIRLKDRSDILVPLRERLQVNLYRLSDKIVTAVGTAWLTHLCETAATLSCEAELTLWEDVRLRLLDEDREERPGKIYGKVISVKPAGDRLQETTIRFTSVSPELYEFIHQTTGGAA